MLRNRKDNETNELKGVVLAADESKLALGRFVLLQNWIINGIAHLQKKRGVVILSSDAVSPEAPDPCAGMSGGGSAGD